MTGTECHYDGTSTEFYSKACTEFLFFPSSVCFHTLLYEVAAVFNLSLLLAVLVALVSNVVFFSPCEDNLFHEYLFKSCVVLKVKSEIFMRPRRP